MGKLHFKVYRPDDKAVFKVTSTIIYVPGEKHESYHIKGTLTLKYLL